MSISNKTFNEILELDTASEEFYQIHTALNQKYFNFKNPDDYQAAAMVLNLTLHRGDDWLVQVLAGFANHLFEIVEKNTPAAHGSFEVSGKTFLYDIYKNKDALAQIHKMFKNTVLLSGDKIPPDRV